MEDGITAADGADRCELEDVLGDGHELGHRLERSSVERHAQSLHDHGGPLGDEFFNQGNQCLAEELRLVDGNEVVGLRPGRSSETADVTDGNRRDVHSVVRSDRGEFGACVEGMGDDENIDSSDRGPTDPPHELLGLAGEHRSGDDFEPARGPGWGGWVRGHGLSLRRGS